MKKIIVTLLIFLPYINYGQNIKVIDSLKRALQLVKTDTDKAKTYYNIALQYLRSDSTKCVENLNKAEGILSKIPEITIFKVRFYNTKAGFFTSNNKYKISDSIYDLSVSLAQKLKQKKDYFIINSLNGKNINNYYRGNKDEYLLGLEELEKMTQKLDTTNIENLRIKYLILKNKGIALAGQGKYEDALIHFKKDVRLQRSLYIPNNRYSTNALINSLNNLAICYGSLEKNKNSLNIFIEALEIETNFPSQTERKNMLYGNISGLFVDIGHYDKAIEYALKINSENKNYLYIKHSNLGSAYLKNLDYSKSLLHYKKANNIAMKMNRKNRLGNSYKNLGLVYKEINIIDSALINLNKARNIFLENRLFNEIASVNFYLGDSYLKKENYKKALFFSNQARIEFEKLNQINDVRIENTENLFKIYKYKKMQKEALATIERLVKLKDQYTLEKEFKELNEIETKYQTQQKENEILKLHNEKAIQEASLVKSRYTIFGILGLLLMGLVVGYFYWTKRKQHHQLALLENSIKTSEAEKSRIGKELHDGIAGSIMKLVYDSEATQIEFSHKLLKTYNEVRALSHQLDNTSGHGKLFLDNVLDLLPKSNQTQQFNFNITPRHLEISAPNDTHIYRIIQELIANNIKHSKATKTTITLSLENNTIYFKYTDNGVGMATFKKGSGFKNIEDRIVLMKGTLNCKTDNGFVISFQIPYTA